MAALNLFRIFRSARSPSKTRHTFWPMLEALDARDVPAVLTWTDATGDDQFLTPGNWTSSDIPSGQPQLATPHEGDDLLFVNFASAGGGGAPGGLSGASGPQGGSPDCYGMQSDPEGAYNSIFVTGGYTGTITVTGPVQTLALAMEAPGTIDQPIAPPTPGQPGGSDISVLGGAVTTPDNQFLLSSLQYDFSWTDGTINSTSNLSNLWLQGCTANINPGGGTLTTGDNVNLTNGAIATLGQGTLTLQNAASLTLNGGSTFVVDPDSQCSATLDEVGAALPSPINLTTGNSITIKSGVNDNIGPVSVTGGTFTLQPNASVSIVGELQDGNAFSQSSGKTILGAGSILTLQPDWQNQPAGSMLVSGGTLARQTNANYDSSLPTSANSAIIAGSLAVSGGDIYAETPGAAGTAVANGGYGRLSVSGNVDWTGGTYHPVVVGYSVDGYGTQTSTNATAPSDLWSAGGTFIIGAGANLAPQVLDSDLGYMGAPSGSVTWLLLTAIPLREGVSRDPLAG